MPWTKLFATILVLLGSKLMAEEQAWKMAQPGDPFYSDKAATAIMKEGDTYLALYRMFGQSRWSATYAIREEEAASSIDSILFLPENLQLRHVPEESAGELLISRSNNGYTLYAMNLPETFLTMMMQAGAWVFKLPDDITVYELTNTAYAIESIRSAKPPVQEPAVSNPATAAYEACAAEAGHPWDQDYTGPTVTYQEINAEDAIEACRHAATLLPDNPTVKYMLARAMDKADDPYCQDLLSELAQEGYAQAQSHLGVLLLKGTHGTKNWDAARYWFEKAALQGNLPGEYWFGIMAYNSSNKVHEQEGVQIVRMVAHRGYPRAMWKYGDMLELGYAPSDSPMKEARSYYEQAASHDFPKGLYALSRFQREGLGGPVEAQAGRRNLERAALLGNSDARKELGLE